MSAEENGEELSAHKVQSFLINLIFFFSFLNLMISSITCRWLTAVFLPHEEETSEAQSESPAAESLVRLCVRRKTRQREFTSGIKGWIARVSAHWWRLVTALLGMTLLTVKPKQDGNVGKGGATKKESFQRWPEVKHQPATGH